MSDAFSLPCFPFALRSVQRMKTGTNPLPHESKQALAWQLNPWDHERVQKQLWVVISSSWQIERRSHDSIISASRYAADTWTPRCWLQSSNTHWRQSFLISFLFPPKRYGVSAASQWTFWTNYLTLSYWCQPKTAGRGKYWRTEDIFLNLTAVSQRREARSWCFLFTCKPRVRSGILWNLRELQMRDTASAKKPQMRFEAIRLKKNWLCILWVFQQLLEVIELTSG